MDLPKRVQWVFHYANATPTKKTWRRIARGSLSDSGPPASPRQPASPIFGGRFREEVGLGVRSQAELEKELAEYRRFLLRWVRLENGCSADAAHLVRELNERAGLEFERWDLTPEAGRLRERWTTKNESFRELLYSCLAAAFREVPFWSIHRCESCAQFFYEPSQRRLRFCSVACRNHVPSLRHAERERHHARAAREQRQREKVRGDQAVLRPPRQASVR